MKAFQAVEKTKQVQMKKQNRYIAKHERYARKITDTKVQKAANKGRLSTTIKVSKRYNKSILAEKIRTYGYDTIIGNKDIKIKWDF